MTQASAVAAGLLVAAATVGGCETSDFEDASTDAPRVDPRVEIGSGELEFEPLTEDQDLEFIRGPQGGLHFLGSIRAWGIEAGDFRNLEDPSNPTTEFQVWLGSDRVDAEASTYIQGLRPSMTEDGAYEMIGRLIILEAERDEELHEMTVELRVVFASADEEPLVDARTIRAISHPLNP